MFLTFLKLAGGGEQVLGSAGDVPGVRMRQCGRTLCGSFAGPGAALTPFVRQRSMLCQAQRNSDSIVSSACTSAFQGFWHRDALVAVTLQELDHRQRLHLCSAMGTALSLRLEVTGPWPLNNVNMSKDTRVRRRQSGAVCSVIRRPHSCPGP